VRTRIGWFSVIEMRSKVSGELLSSWSDEGIFLNLCTAGEKKYTAPDLLKVKIHSWFLSHDLNLEKE